MNLQYRTNFDSNSFWQQRLIKLLFELVVNWFISFKQQFLIELAMDDFS